MARDGALRFRARAKRHEVAVSIEINERRALHALAD
jgi:hypothetical protein